jgi:phage shock protein PspC (stress-responsive transcriptional regulator)
MFILINSQTSNAKSSLAGEITKMTLVFYRKKSVFLGNMNKLKYFVEWHVFGVCTAIGERMGIASSIIRKYFIYISFLTVGSPLIIYLFVAFWMNVKKYVRISRRNPAGI